MELGTHQIYELVAMFDYSVIAIKVIPDPNLSLEVREKAYADSNELVRSVQRLIDDLMKKHMTTTFEKAPVICYIPCSQCKKMHLSVEEATERSNIYCPVSRVYADITDYHKILSGLYYELHAALPAVVINSTVTYIASYYNYAIILCVLIQRRYFL